MPAMPMHLPTEKLHVPVEKLHLDKLPLDKLPTDRLPFAGRKRSRRPRKALLLGVPALGLVAALVTYWRRTRAMSPQEYLEADVKQQADESLARVGITKSAPTSAGSQHRTA